MGVVGQYVQPAHLAVHVPPFRVADRVPNARQPVGDQRERGHEQQQHGRAVLRVPVDLPRHPHQSQQPGRLQQTDQGGRLQVQHSWVRVLSVSSNVSLRLHRSQQTVTVLLRVPKNQIATLGIASHTCFFSPSNPLPSQSKKKRKKRNTRRKKSECTLNGTVNTKTSSANF